MNDEFWRLLATPTPTLAAFWETTAAEVTRARRAMTGATKALSPTWAPAFGCWGGVRTLAEIAARTGQPHFKIRDYAKGMHLRMATSKSRRTHAELAVLLYADRRRPAVESCRTYGVLPAERRLLLTYLENLLRQERLVLAGLLRYTPEQLEAAWQRGTFDMDGLANGAPVFSLDDMLVILKRQSTRASSTSTTC